METLPIEPLKVRLVRYVASRLRQERPARFTRLDSALSWWAHSTRQSPPPPEDFINDVNLLHTIADIVQAALDGPDDAHFVESSNTGHAVVRETGLFYRANQEFPDFDWKRVFAELLVRERGYLYPSEKAERIPNETALKALHGTSFAWREVMQRIRACAAEEVTTLFVGETGSGKSLISEIVHKAGPRSNQPMITFNCELADIETIREDVEKLFTAAGIETDSAPPQSLFRFNGTLLFEEVGLLPASIQSLVVEGIESIEKEREKKGSEGVFPRLLFTTSRPLDQIFHEGGFRQDLFYRIAVFQIDLPALRQRREDIPLLTQNILSQLAAKHQVMTPRIDREAIQKLERHTWPGNIRELRNVLESGLLQAGEKLGKEQIDFERSVGRSAFMIKDSSMAGILERLESLHVNVSKSNPEILVQFLRYATGRRFRTHELAEDLNIAASTARAYIHRLVEAGLIRKFGEKKGTTYQVVESEFFKK